ncbi:hypothetical protein ACIGD1_33365 [Streptomyces sp. NPDC085612]|uniref:hypothetical protein n=1 Tax=Streptomyces sp. NPDC085612 TaxID=3365732 RepID=UPI0037D875D1
MTTYAFKFEAEPPTNLEVVEESFYEHFDGLVAVSFGRLLLTVYADGHRNGVVAARCVAVEIYDKLNVIVRRMDRDLVDASEIARRIDRTRESVRQIISGERRKGQDFPTPLGAPNGKRIWEWAVVDEWLKSNVPEVADSEVYLCRDEMTAVDNWLLLWSTMPREEHVLSTFYEITASQTPSEAHQTRRKVHDGWVSSWAPDREPIKLTTVPLRPLNEGV